MYKKIVKTSLLIVALLMFLSLCLCLGNINNIKVDAKSAYRDSALDLQERIFATDAGGVLMLDRDYGNNTQQYVINGVHKVPAINILIDKPITIDINGCDLYSIVFVINVKDNDVVVIKDSQGTGSINQNRGAIDISKYSGTINALSGKIYLDNLNVYDAPYSGIVATTTNSTLNVSGANVTINSGYYYNSSFNGDAIYVNKGSLTINDVFAVSDKNPNLYPEMITNLGSALVFTTSSKVEISNGMFQSVTRSGAVVCGSSITTQEGMSRYLNENVNAQVDILNEGKKIVVKSDVFSYLSGVEKSGNSYLQKLIMNEDKDVALCNTLIGLNENVEYKWLYRQKYDSIDEVVVSTDKILNITPLTKNDYGIYTCIIKDGQTTYRYVVELKNFAKGFTFLDFLFIFIALLAIILLVIFLFKAINTKRYVYFIVDEMEVGKVMVHKGDSIVLPNIFTKEQWFIDKEMTQPFVYVDEKMGKKDICLYGKAEYDNQINVIQPQYRLKSKKMAKEELELSEQIVVESDEVGKNASHITNIYDDDKVQEEAKNAIKKSKKQKNKSPDTVKKNRKTEKDTKNRKDTKKEKVVNPLISQPKPPIKKRNMKRKNK